MDSEPKTLRPSIGTPSKNPETKRTFRPEKAPEGPDGAKSWVVAFAAFMINFIMAGLSRMSGILYVAFIEMFNIDRKGASMPFSVRSSTMNLLGPVVGILGQKYGVRKVSVIGGILGTLSAAACYFAEDITWLTIMWGGVNGVGTALVTTLTTVVIGQYFDKYKTTASGMSFSGACIGSFIFPPLIEELLHLYGLGGSFLIVAGIIMHVIPAAMILRKPIWVKRANRLAAAKDIESATGGKTGKNSTLKPGNVTGNENPSGVDLNYLRANSELVFKLLTADASVAEGNNNISHPPKDEILREMEDVYSFVGKPQVSLKPSQVPPKMRIKFDDDTSPVTGKSKSFRMNRLSVDDNEHSPVQKSVSSVENSKSSQCKPFILSKLNEIRSKNESQITSSFKNKPLCTKVLKELRKLHKVYEAVQKRNIFSQSKEPTKTPKITQKLSTSKPVKKVQPNGFWDSIKASVKLHGNPLFLLIALCRAIHFSTFIPAVTIIVDYTMDKGLMEEDGKYVIAALSVGDLLGRLGFGWVTDRGFISLPRYMMIVMVFQGICTAFLPALNTKMTLLPTIAMYAMLQGSVFVRHSVLISKYMKSGEQSIAMGCVNFFAGLLGFAVPAYVGFFRDTMGSYDGIFYLNGAVGALAGLLWIFEPCLVKSTSDSPVDGSQVDETKV